MIVDNENNGNFHPEENFYQLVTVNNQDIFDVEGEIERRFSAYYTEGISVNLASWLWFCCWCMPLMQAVDDVEGRQFGKK